MLPPNMGIINDFIGKVRATQLTGLATEHSYRSAIEGLFHAIAGDITALNEPKRVACGAPDFIVQRGQLAVGHVEAKDLGVDLQSMNEANREQQSRYRKALPNLIYTNCLDWEFFRRGELVASVTIGNFAKGIPPSPDQFDALEDLLRDFVAQLPQSITSPKTLAEMMAGKASIIKDVVGMRSPTTRSSRGPWRSIQELSQHLLPNLTPGEFADIYAETITYGMFAARLHDLARHL